MSDEKCQQPPGASGSDPGSASDPGGEPEIPKEVSFRQLAGHRSVVLIEHQGQVYRLTETKSGKLVMTK